ncbi:hypothetical protein [Streptomyces longwoodensis]|uniref:hypothetical protein n=1 Tax=Streptomyces longwoodensis TaxID=68231 RepID=UPI0033ECF685
MTTPRTPAPAPAETPPGVSVHPGADRRLATEHWLLSTLPTSQARAKARCQWSEHGLAMLPLGGLMSAVRIPAAMVQALARKTSLPATDTFLAHALKGGPVICAMHGGRRYYVLVPGRVPQTRHDLVAQWARQDIECLGRGAYLGVPPPDQDHYAPATQASYWSVPMESAGALCLPRTVAQFISAGGHALGQPGVESGA